MKVVSIRSKQFLGGYMSRPAETMPDWVGFLAGASATTFGPTLLYCVASFGLLPLYVMGCVATAGALAGVYMFRRPAEYLLLRIPLTRRAPGEKLARRDGRAA
jgi:hypothetical protein